MAQYAFPHDLFPPTELIGHLNKEGSWTPFEEELRAKAFLGYSQVGKPDKELTRFMTPMISWGVEKGAASSYRQLGERSWIATLDRAPHIPSACYDLLHSSMNGPRSLMHLIGATFHRVRIMYCAESLEHVALEDSLGGKEVLFMILEKGISVKVQDSVNSPELSARVIVGSLASHSDLVWVSEHTGGVILQHDSWHLEKGSHLEMLQVLTGARQSWLRKEYVLNDEAHMKYTFLGSLRGTEQSALTTVQEHRGLSSSSSVLVKTVGTDQAKSFYRGTIAIFKDAHKSVALQQQRALLLSPGARTCAIPSLEVATHEVQCSHGSAVGQFDEEKLQYLRSRGMSVECAKHLLIEGFFNEPLCVAHPEIHKRLMLAVWKQQ